jgi:hypothetical protein
MASREPQAAGAMAELNPARLASPACTLSAATGLTKGAAHRLATETTRIEGRAEEIATLEVA